MRELFGRFLRRRRHHDREQFQPHQQRGAAWDDVEGSDGPGRTNTEVHKPAPEQRVDREPGP